MGIKRILILGSLIISYNALKAPGLPLGLMGSIQLWPVTIINRSNVKIVVIDELIYHNSSDFMFHDLDRVTPNNQFTFQWPDQKPRPGARKITIVGYVTPDAPTNKIIFGNTADSTAWGIPSGDHTIISVGRGEIAEASKTDTNQSIGR